MEKNEKSYTNGEITVFWRPESCIHASICYTRLLEVFNPRKRPWVNMSGASSEEIIRVVNQCPTDALTWKYNDDSRNNRITDKDLNHVNIRKPGRSPVHDAGEKESTGSLSKPTEIMVSNNGPYIIKGDFILDTPLGPQYKTMKTISLCRCGHSASKPFCDGSHRRFSFTG